MTGSSPTPAPSRATADEGRPAAQMFFAALAAVLLALVVGFEYDTLHHNTTVTVVRSAGGAVVTTTNPAPIASSLVGALLALAIVMMLLAVFYDRITGVQISGIGGIDLAAAKQMAVATAAKSGGDPAKAQRILDRVAPQVVAATAGSRPRKSRITAGTRATAWAGTLGAEGPELINRLVDEAAAAVGHPGTGATADPEQGT